MTTILISILLVIGSIFGPTATGSSPAVKPMPVQPSAGGAGTASASTVISGSATWYAWRAGQAAAGPGLRAFLGPQWRGETVRVCSSSCVVVTLTDWCLCGGDRIIDLDSRSFAALAPLSQGIVHVTVSRAGGPRPTAPPTDYVR